MLNLRIIGKKDGRIYYAVNNLVRKLVVFSGFVCIFVCFVWVFFRDGGGQNIALYIHL